MADFYVYAHVETDTGNVFYIGKGRGRRAYNFTNRNIHWNNKYNKHGCTVRILHENLSECDAFDIEKKEIARIGRCNLVNYTDGGEGMSNPSAETRLKLSESHKGIKKSDEEKLAISIRMSGSKNHWFGKTFSDTHKERLSQSLSGRNLTPEHARNIGESVTKKEVITLYNPNAASLFIGQRNEMKSFGLSNCEISMICSGKRKSAKGWHTYG